MGNRLSSLDILRGLTIAIMILVNFQPDESVASTILVHKPWEGITLADVAFPSFVFIMGDMNYRIDMQPEQVFLSYLLLMYSVYN